MDILTCKDYRELLEAYLNSEGTPTRGRRSQLAAGLQMHASHLSQILAGQRSLTPDQALVFARLGGLSELEREYLLTLVHKERSASLEFRKYCEQKIREIQTKSKDIAQRVNLERQLDEEDKAQFYSHYLYSAIRLYCSTAERGRIISEIEKRFSISRDRLMPIIRFLIDKGLLTEKNDHFRIGTASTFLPRESPQIHRHHANWRLLAIHDSYRLGEDEIMFTAPISIAKKDFHEIRENLLKEIAKASALVKASEAEDVACLNIDFFWLKS